MERVVWRTASLIDMHTYSDSYSYLINISVCFIIWCTCIISFRFQYFPASCAERNLNPIENGKNIWIPGLMNGCGSCVLSGSPRWKKRSRRGGWVILECMLQTVTWQRRGFYPMVFPLIWFLFRGEWLWVLVSRVPQEYLRLIVPNSWRTDVAVRAMTEMVRWIRVNQLNKRRKKEIEQGWDAASSPSLTTTRSLCQIAVRSMRMIAREPEYSPSRHDLSRDYQQNTISLEGKVISVYITLTPKAARNPQIISSFVRQSKSLFHDIFFFRNPLHDHVASS